MESTQRRLFLVRIATSENSILDAWDSLVDMLTRVEIGFVQGLQRYLEETSSKKSITTIILPGKSGILIETYGLSEKELHLLSQVKRDLSEALWETYQSSWRASNPLTAKHYFTQQYMEQAVKWEECKLKASVTAKEMSSEQAWLIKTNTMLGYEKEALKLEEETLMNRHMLTNELKTSFRRIPLQ